MKKTTILIATAALAALVGGCAKPAPEATPTAEATEAPMMEDTVSASASDPAAAPSAAPTRAGNDTTRSENDTTK
ncbi:hypothetical protein [Novosphingobium jiangmenense]|uniref:Uncharacterized protein n=1 Tax=Novosphingobium jiangmenense TaxID=2791981 RepID=A0ABS0HB91_9SPHN|nr:hypothetical protein [Novosphingobium jiangmenense]MBF9149543.1 hypothetical protein [Novosphingobium jiangmenense]